MTMRRQFPAFLLTAALACTPALVFGQQSTTDQDRDAQHRSEARQDMHNAGQDTKDAARNAGHATKRTTKKAYHKTKRDTKKAWNKTKSTTKGAVHGGEEGAHQPQ